MIGRILRCVTLAASLAVSSGLADDSQNTALVGWGIVEKDIDTFIADAAAVGFDALITWSGKPATLELAVKAGASHGIKVFSCITPMGGLAKAWSQQYPDRPVPWQVMTPDEEAAMAFIKAGKNQYLIPYQFGGEPQLTNEVLLSRIVCFNNREYRELYKPLIDGIVAVPGLEGLAFDGFGYQNYRRCHCEHCQQLLEAYRAGHPEMTASDAEVAFFRDALVDYINYLADYARSRRADIKTTIHIWPVFAPEPLYGNRLDVDYCGQTAAWYMLWPREKIAEYSRIISGEATRYHSRQQGVGMIGYYDRPGQFPVKDAARVDMELTAMIQNGCRRIQVCGARDVIQNKEIAAVFQKHFR